MKFNTVEEMSQYVSEGDRIVCMGAYGIIDVAEVIKLIPQTGEVEIMTDLDYRNNTTNRHPVSAFNIAFTGDDIIDFIYNREAAQAEIKDAKFEELEEYRDGIFGKIRYFATRTPAQAFFGYVPGCEADNFIYADNYITFLRRNESGLPSAYCLRPCFSYHNDETGYDYWCVIDSFGQRDYFEMEGDDYIIEPVESQLNRTIERVRQYVGL